MAMLASPQHSSLPSFHFFLQPFNEETNCSLVVWVQAHQGEGQPRRRAHPVVLWQSRTIWEQVSMHCMHGIPMPGEEIVIWHAMQGRKHVPKSSRFPWCRKKLLYLFLAWGKTKKPYSSKKSFPIFYHGVTLSCSSCPLLNLHVALKLNWKSVAWLFDYVGLCRGLNSAWE